MNHVHSNCKLSKKNYQNGLLQTFRHLSFNNIWIKMNSDLRQVLGCNKIKPVPIVRHSLILHWCGLGSVIGAVSLVHQIVDISMFQERV